MRFNNTDSRECPAAATTSLVLDWGNDAEVAPVPRCRDILELISEFWTRRRCNCAYLVCLDDVEIVDELLVSHI